MRRWPWVALFLVPLLDVVLLVYVASVIGGVATVALVVLTALIGLMLVRAEGRHTVQRLQERLATGEVPTKELMDGGLLIAAGAFLLTPGVVTDAIGFLLVIPITRAPVRWALKKWIIVPKLDAKTGGFASGNVYTFGFPQSGESEGVDPEDFDLGGGSGPFGGASTGDVDGDGGRDAGSGSSGDETVDLGSDEYDVEDDDR